MFLLWREAAQPDSLRHTVQGHCNPARKILARFTQPLGETSVKSGQIRANCVLSSNKIAIVGPPLIFPTSPRSVGSAKSKSLFAVNHAPGAALQCSPVNASPYQPGWGFKESTYGSTIGSRICFYFGVFIFVGVRQWFNFYPTRSNKRISLYLCTVRAGSRLQLQELLGLIFALAEFQS